MRTNRQPSPASRCRCVGGRSDPGWDGTVHDPTRPNPIGPPASFSVVIG